MIVILAEVDSNNNSNYGDSSNNSGSNVIAILVAALAAILIVVLLKALWKNEEGEFRENIKKKWKGKNRNSISVANRISNPWSWFFSLSLFSTLAFRVY